MTGEEGETGIFHMVVWRSVSLPLDPTVQGSIPDPGPRHRAVYCLMGDQTRATGAFALFCEQIALLLTKNVSIAKKPMS